jgi:hypothetical protein
MAKDANIDFITPLQVADDILNDRLVGYYHEGKLCAFCAVVPEPEFGYTAIKRLLTTPVKDTYRILVARHLFQHILATVEGDVGGTPWEDNTAMCKLNESLGFKLQYKFGKYCFYRYER